MCKEQLTGTHMGKRNWMEKKECNNNEIIVQGIWNDRVHVEWSTGCVKTRHLQSRYAKC